MNKPSMIRAVVKYPGAKWCIASWVIEHLPAHHSYLEEDT